MRLCGKRGDEISCEMYNGMHEMQASTSYYLFALDVYNANESIFSPELNEQKKKITTQEKESLVKEMR